jgi:hypothetical protein
MGYCASCRQKKPAADSLAEERKNCAEMVLPEVCETNCSKATYLGVAADAGGAPVAGVAKAVSFATDATGISTDP